LIRMSRLLIALLALALCAGLAATASADTVAKGKKKVALKIVSDSQAGILQSGVEVKVKAKGKLAKKARRGKRPKVKVKLSSSTFDTAKAGQLAKPEKLRLSKRGKGFAEIELSKDGRSQVASCEARTLVASARGATAKRDLVRDTADCKPKPIDLSRADACDFIGAQDTSRCMLPFPDDYYTSEDADTETGKRIDFKPDAAPANTGDVHLDPADYAGNDGFSPGQTIVVRVPGLDNPEALGQTNPVGLRKLGKYSKKGAPVVVIDATTGERQPIWARYSSGVSSVSMSPSLRRRSLKIQPRP